MTCVVEKIFIPTKGFDDVIDITSKIQNIIVSLGVKEGMVNIFSSSLATSILTLESEPALSYDLLKLIEAYVPINKVYQHDNLWHNGNAHSHLKAALLGNNITLPIQDSKIALGAYQQIIMIDFDNKSSQKEILITVTY